MANAKNVNVLRSIITPKLARNALKDNGAMTRWWLFMPAKLLSEMSREAFGIRQLVWSVMTGAYLAVDRAEADASDKALAAAWVFDKKAVWEFLFREAQDAKTGGSNGARKLLDYAQESRVPLREMVWSKTQCQLRRENDTEAAARHLDIIAYFPKEDQPNRAKEYRESMVMHGFFTAAEGKVITDAAVKRRKEDDAKRATAEAAKPKPPVQTLGDLGRSLMKS